MIKQSLETLLEAYKSIITIRQVEDIEENHVKQGKAFFYMPSKGHEATIALSPSLIDEDYLACHYRDKGLMVARGAKPLDFFNNMFCKADSDSAGRQMSAFLHNKNLHMLSLSGPVTNAALHACGIAAELKRSENYSEKKPIAYCGLGDGMTQEGEFYEAVLYAMMHKLPVLFIVQDNGYAISTKTKGKTFFSTAKGDETSFCGVPLERLDGTDFNNLQENFSEIIARIRNRASNNEGVVPAIVVLKTERLSSHTNADDHTVYRSKEELENAYTNNDLLPKLEKKLIELGASKEQLETIQNEIAKTISKDLEQAANGKEPTAVHDAKLPVDFTKIENKGIELNTQTKEKYSDTELTMNEAINAVLFNRLANDKRVTLFGEDIEDPKGDVFGVTKGLSTAFPTQVQNAPLAEATIAGVSVGRALAGGKPVAFFQFADFMPPAFNQLFSEVGNMYWRTNGAWQNPAIFMVSCGAYRPGLGPFHASTLEQMILQVPGIDVFMPSNATQAAKLLNTAFESNRPTVFFYPKNCLNAKALATDSTSITRCGNPTRLEKVMDGNDITLAGWGNAVALLKSAAEIIGKSGKKAEVLDLPSLSPWDLDGVVQSVKKTNKLLVVQENNISCSFASEVASSVSEVFSKNEKIEQPIVRRLSRGDTYVPFHYENQLEVLPSVTSVVETAVEMIGGSLEWKEEGSDSSENTNTIVKASGTSPSDEIITVVEWLVKEGDTINQGDILANMEANKAAFEFASPVSGTIVELFVKEGDSADVGENLFSVEGEANQDTSTPVTREIIKEAVITWKEVTKKTVSTETVEKADIGIAGLTYVTGSNKVLSTDLDAKYGWESSEKKNGIKERYWVKDGEDAVMLGFKAAKNLLQKLNLSITDIDSIICATGSPVNISPSNACMILNKISTDEGKMSTATAFDFSAACSGYIYGLQMAWDYINAKPNHRVLLITAEVLTPQLKEDDIGTAPIFSDAATATIICSSKTSKLEAIVERPQTSTLAEDGSILKIPRDSNDPIFMDGPAVFLAAVRGMSDSLRQTCEETGIKAEDIDLVVPHQANQRIIDAVRKKLKITEEKAYSNIANYGNTSSCTIPIALNNIFKGEAKGNIALCAFGAGFTIGSCLLRR